MGAFLGITLLLGITFNWNGVTSFNNLYYFHQHQTAENIQMEIDARMEMNLRSAEMSLHLISNNPIVGRAFARRERETLLQIFQPMYGKMKKMGIDQFQFHLPDSRSFLRLHKPEKFGDDLSSFRHTVNQANRDKKIIRGLEEGRAGFGFRVVSPVTFEGSHTGTVEFGFSFGKVFLKKMKEDFGGEYFIYTFKDKSSVAWDETSSGFLSGTLENDPTAKSTGEMLKRLKEGKLQFHSAEDGRNLIILIPFRDYQGNVRGFIKAIHPVDAVREIRNQSLMITLIITSVGLIISFIIAYILMLLITIPMNRSMKFADEVSSGDLTTEVTLDRNDETGQLVMSLDSMRARLRELLAEINVNSDSSFRASEELSHSASEVNLLTQQVSVAMEELAAGASGLNDSSGSAWDSVVRLTESQKKVTMIANGGHTEALDIRDSSRSAADAARNASQMIEKIKDKMNFTSKSVESLRTKIGGINELTGSINAISDEINLLSLNASIEAARAGEAGRGFAVVAEHISRLADQSGQASEDINHAIGEIVNSSHETVHLIEQGVEEVGNGAREVHYALDRTEQINHMIENLVNSMEGISSAAESQMKLTEFVRDSISHVSGVSQESAAAVEEVASSVEQISGLMESLNESADALRSGSEILKKLIHRFRV